MSSSSSPLTRTYLEIPFIPLPRATPPHTRTHTLRVPSVGSQPSSVKQDLDHFFGSCFDARRTFSQSVMGFVIHNDAMLVPPHQISSVPEVP